MALWVVWKHSYCKWFYSAYFHFDFSFQNQGSPELEADYKCTFLHHNNPFLRIAPFKFEQKHSDPEIALIHDFASVNETEKIKNLARGKMKSTPYIVSGKSVTFTKSRTSKVMYMNERHVPEAEVITVKAQQITKLNLYNERFARWVIIYELVLIIIVTKCYQFSENYQIMNYGIGGKINGHLDSPGVIYEHFQEMGNT